MSEPIAIEPPRYLPIAALLSRADRSSLRELARHLREALDAPFFRAFVDARFVIRETDLHGTSPTFPGAVIVAEGLDALHATPSGGIAVDRDAFLATPVLLAAGRLRTIEEVLALAAESADPSAQGEWPALDITVRAIARVVLDALRSAGPPVGDLRPLLAHHTVAEGTSLFVARDAALHTLGVDAPLDGGLSWAMSVRLVRPQMPRHRIVYEVGDVSATSLLFSVHVSKDGCLHVLCRPGEGPVLELGVRIEGIFDRFVTLMAVVRLTPHTRLRVWVDDALVGSVRGDASKVQRLVGRQSIGAGVLGRHRSALFLRELLLLGSPIGPTTRARVARRFDRHTARPR
jgi:hypothetical protein